MTRVGRVKGRAGRVAGKVAIVTGAGSTPGPGMATGRASAIVLAREGARVLVADIRRDRAQETRDIIAAEGQVGLVPQLPLDEGDPLVSQPLVHRAAGMRVIEVGVDHPDRL